MSGNIWITSDLHFGHKNIINYCREQYDTIGEHNEAIIENINSVVKKRDTLVILGDLCFGATNMIYFKQLNGYKRVVMGNHDHYNMALYAHYDVGRLHGAWEKAGLIFTHIPVHPMQFERFNGNVHGHLHEGIITKWMPNYKFDEPPTVEIADDRYFNACLEQHDMMPVHLDDIRKHFTELSKDNTV